MLKSTIVTVQIASKIHQIKAQNLSIQVYMKIL